MNCELRTGTGLGCIPGSDLSGVRNQELKRLNGCVFMACLSVCFCYTGVVWYSTFGIFL